MRSCGAARAAWLLAVSVAVTFAQSGYELYQKALLQERARGNLKEAMQLYERIVREFASDRPLAAKALLQLGGCYEKLGRTEARKAYEQLLRNYPDQGELATEARKRLRALKATVVERGLSGPVEQLVATVSEPPLVGMPYGNGRYLPIITPGRWELVIRDLVTGQERRLTALSYDPHLSPDGAQVAFIRRNTEGRWELYVMGLDGSEARLLHGRPETYGIFICAWSPDGKHILVRLRNRDVAFQLALVALRDGAIRLLSKPEKLDRLDLLYSRPSFSPDGRHIVFSRDGDLFTLTTGGQETVLMKNPAQERVAGWAPDGSGILFISNRSGTWDAWLLPMSGSSPRGTPLLVKSNIGQEIVPKGFRDGAFYYTVLAYAQDVYLAAFEPLHGKVLAKPALAPRGSAGLNFMPVWSRTGRSLAYLSARRDDTYVICIVTPDTGEVREVAVSELSVFPHVPMDWSPDEREFLAHAGNFSGNRGLFRIDARSGGAIPVFLDQRLLLWNVLWSDSGEAIFYTGVRDLKTLRLVRRELASGLETVLLEAPGGSLSALAGSPDGKQLAFTIDGPGGTSSILQLMPTTGGEASELFRVSAPEEISTVAWMPDGRYLLFGWNRGTKGTELWRIPAGGGRPAYAGVTVENLRQLRVHPDGRRLAFTAGFVKWELWVMRNFLPAKAGN